MTSARILRPPRFLARLYLVLAAPLTAMMLALAAIGLSRGYLASGLWCLFLAVAVAGGIPSALRLRRSN